MEKSRKHVRVVMDTSVCLAALLSESGGSAAVLEKVIEQEVFNFYTEDIISELQEILKRPKFELAKETQTHFTHIVQESSFEVRQLQDFKIQKCRDPKDDIFLSLANQIEADFLVSLDNDLLVIGRLGNTKIVTPGEFLKSVL